MMEALDRIIVDIERNLECVEINFGDDVWRRSIPASAGWYLIITNAPIDVLRSVGQPRHKAHINLPAVIESTSRLRDIGIAIAPSGNRDYVVYNGEAQNLKARAREHASGHPKTACLGLADYETLRQQKWTFCYVPMSRIKDLPKEDKALRLAVEQGWRAKNGWPILCGK